VVILFHLYLEHLLLIAQQMNTWCALFRQNFKQIPMKTKLNSTGFWQYYSILKTTELHPSSIILEQNTMFHKLDHWQPVVKTLAGSWGSLKNSSITHWTSELRLRLSNSTNSVGASPPFHVSTATRQVSEVLCVLLGIQNDEQSPESYSH
jgi:hypothetical protein